MAEIAESLLLAHGREGAALALAAFSHRLVKYVGRRDAAAGESAPRSAS